MKRQSGSPVRLDDSALAQVVGGCRMRWTGRHHRRARPRGGMIESAPETGIPGGPIGGAAEPAIPGGAIDPAPERGIQGA